MKLRVLSIAIVAVVLALPAAARARTLPDRSIVAGTESLLSTSLASLSTRTGPADPRYFADGVWQSGDDSCWWCQVAPGTAAAVLWKTSGERDPRLKELAVSTFDRAISDHRNPNGSFGNPTDGPDIVSMMFGVELGTTFLELRSSLSSARRQRWRMALTGAADFLIANGNLSWYTNGNINLGNAELFYLAWRASDDQRYLAAYNSAWNFALHPPQGRWPGFGLHLIPGQAISASGTHLGGAAGYLAESGGAAPGFDPEYAELQLDVVTRLYVLSRDPRALHLADLLVNALLPHVNGQWYLNTSGGTRHTQTGRFVPFLTPALIVLGWLGHRPALAHLAASQFSVIDQTYSGACTYTNVGLYRGWGNEVAVILQAAAAADPQIVKSS